MARSKATLVPSKACKTPPKARNARYLRNKRCVHALLVAHHKPTGQDSLFSYQLFQQALATSLLLCLATYVYVCLSLSVRACASCWSPEPHEPSLLVCVSPSLSLSRSLAVPTQECIPQPLRRSSGLSWSKYRYVFYLESYFRFSMSFVKKTKRNLDCGPRIQKCMPGEKCAARMHRSRLVFVCVCLSVCVLTRRCCLSNHNNERMCLRLLASFSHICM